MLLDLNALPLVDMEFMNEVHKEDVEIINRLFEALLDYETDPGEEKALEIDTIFEKWYDHTVAHFAGEEERMLETGFPPYHMHKGEHDRALARMRMIQDTWHQNREVKPMKIYFIEELPQWLVNHIETMDTVTARFFKSGISPCGV